MQHIRKILLSFLLLSLVLSLTACNRQDNFLSWNAPPLSFIGEYEENGVRFTARFSAEGDQLCAAILSPDDAAGVSFCMKKGICTVTYGDHTEQINTVPAPICRFLLLYPEAPVLSQVVRDGNARLVYVSGRDGSYCYRFEEGSLPTSVTAETESGFLSLTIRSE